jgi:hypothetical protein
VALNGSGLFQYEKRLGDPDPFGNFLEARFRGSLHKDLLFSQISGVENCQPFLRVPPTVRRVRPDLVAPLPWLLGR